MPGKDSPSVLEGKAESHLRDDMISVADHVRADAYMVGNLVADAEPATARMSRVAKVLAGGMSSGLGQAVNDALERPGVSSLKVLSAAGIGAALSLMQRRAGLVRLGGQIIGGSLAYSLAADVAGRTKLTGRAIADSWNSDRNLETNKQVIGQTLGPFAVDFALMSAGAGLGAAGTRAGLARFENYQLRPIDVPGLQLGVHAAPESVIRVPRNSPLAELYLISRKSVGRVEVLAGQGRGIEGRTSTVFAVSRDGKLATAAHVVRDSLDITVFDYKGRPHKASVIGRDDILPVSDVAILQLENPSSYKHFKPLKPGDPSVIATDAGPSFYGLVGHPNGWGKLYVSPGVPITTGRGPGVTRRFEMHAQPGYCGGPVCGTDGKVYAMMIQGPRLSNGQVYATPIQHIQRVLSAIRSGSGAEMATAGAAKPAAVASPVFTEFTALNHAKATANLETIFGERFHLERPPDFFHSRVKQVPIETDLGGSQKLALQMQYSPVEGQVVVRPFALDGRTLPRDLTWMESKVPISEAVLKVKLLRDGTPLSMRSVNDPHLTLQKAFNYRGDKNYLAEL